MSTASNKDSEAPMNDVELDEILKMPLLGCDIQEWADAINQYIAQEKANLQAALEAELPQKLMTADGRQSIEARTHAFNEAIDQCKEAIAAVFNKGDK